MANMLHKYKSICLAVCLLAAHFSSLATTYNWNTWVAGALTYNTTNMSATVANTNFTTFGPQDPNGGASNGYKSPKYVSNATIATYQGGFTNDYGLQGLVLGLDWANLTSSTTVTITFATPVAGPVSFDIYDINTGSWGGNDPVWIDKITVAGTNCAGAAVYPVISGCGNNISGANSNIITGRSACTNSTNTITFNASTIKTITITYASGGPLASGYGTDPDAEYIIISSITTGNNAQLVDATASAGGLTCNSPTTALNGVSSVNNATYSWTGPNSGSAAGTTPTAASTTVSAPGTYVLAVTDPSSGCSFNDTVVVTQNINAPGGTIAPPAQLSCTVSSVTLTASSAVNGVSYAWSAGGTGNPKTVMAAGTYTVTITDPSNGCSSTASALVTSSGSGLSVSASSVGATCGNANGSATVSLSSGTAIGYSWSNGASTATAANLAGGTYTVTVTGNGGCSATASVSVTATSALSLSSSSTTATCSQVNGTATVNATGGSSLTYLWSNGDNTPTADSLAGGSYNVTVTDAGGCSATVSVPVSSTAGFVLIPSSTPTTCGLANGSAAVDVISSIAAGYVWSNGDTAAAPSNLAGGNYSVTVTAISGCTASATVSVAASSGLAIASSSTAATCGNANGTATVNLVTGAATAYNWSTGASTPTVSGLSGGTYTVTVTGSGGCSATGSINVSATTGLALQTSSVNSTCGNNNGSAAVTVATGTAPFGYLWSNGGATAAISNVSAGTYTVTVTGAGGCSATAAIAINGGTTNPVTVFSEKTLMCVGDSTDICAPTGYASYLWNTGATTRCISTTLAGNYYLTVTDNGGCSATSNHLAINVRPQPPVSISVNGDSLLSYAAVTYQWYFNGVEIGGANSPLWVAGQSGFYTVQVTDTNGCTATSLPVNVTLTGMETVYKDELGIFPNPLQTGSWNLNCGAVWLGGEIEIFDNNGRLLYKAEIKDSRQEIDLVVAKGFYLARLVSKAKSKAVKLIKL
jgi:hypothetical protein